MNGNFIEKLKSLILTVLIFTGIIQMGVLWRYQNHGLPISILETLFSGISNINTARGLEEIKSRVFVPEEIIVSDTLSQSHWSLDSSGKEYKDLWAWAQAYLVTVLDPAFKQRPEVIQSSEWSRLFGSSPFAIIFDSPMNVQMVKLFMGISQNPSPYAPQGLYKMLLSPWEDFNNVNTIYIYDGSRIYKYKLPFHALDNREKYRNIMRRVSSNTNLINYSLMQELDPNNRLGYPINRDVAVINRGPIKSLELPNIYSYIPENIRITHDVNDAEMDRIANLILGRERDNYDDPELNKRDNTLVMRSQNSRYRLYQEGIMEYEYIGLYEEYVQGNIGDAFANALMFINNRLKSAMVVDSFVDKLYLSGSRQVGKSYYEFTFDYKVENVPVHFNEFSPGTRTDIRLKNAITIRANEKRVISCWWVIRDFETTGQPLRYNIGFDDFMYKLSDTYMDLFAARQIRVKDIDVALFMPVRKEKLFLKPVWRLKTENNSGESGFYIIDLSVAKDPDTA